MNATPLRPGAAVIAERGWFAAHKWLILRRASQIGILLLFLVGPWFSLWIVKGNLNYSYTLDILPLTDPYLLLQMLAAGHTPEKLAWIGVAIVVIFYFLLGGRTYCSWVCPVNPVSDGANWLRTRLGLKGGAHLSRSTRYWILAMTLIVAAITGTIAWEMVNPVAMTHRGLIYGMGFAWVVLLAIFLFDLLVMRQGWCGHLCPVGAFYSLIGKLAVLRVRLPARDACDDCLDCFAVCPEQQVIRPALKAINGTPPVILEANCTNCGRCIDVCAKSVFVFGSRFGGKMSEPVPSSK
ncbi:MAG: quinol dehydrogenase ferredoxin subunit NapH [Gammaproteobacteria bacterium]|nr:quinol dehydrogenase ferredoxin subunit NapH [Rhodocyclaceae bacterium]MBU3909286.1 quinol dehydrogenase ferredoxin subunit NapH [Gammaproteobacteria bacterium]MBU3989520.1 quinol dehydrogenase ferredoxin subunit NapH [Gammaproteobacteria bacterium]MBU4005554.1 quinol dehydrogenase ferredoxin subunit NapH [Gammaproteobacteria bacterium]MBU4020893.1 quinol dehydrogenase ferredoxin subunit NapH [Gammaproteobacteria bacterium]